MGNLDSANLKARRNAAGLPPVDRCVAPYGTVPKPPDNGAAHRAELLDLDIRERALALAIEAMKQGLTPAQCWTDHKGQAIDTAKVFYTFLKGDPK